MRGVHGLHGAVRVEVLTDRPSERFARGAVLYREGSDAPLTIAEAVADSPGWRLRFDEIVDRNGADTLRDVYLDAVVPPEAHAADSYYWHDLIGVAVRDLEGRGLGSVRDVYRVGESEVLVVSGGPAGEFDVPIARPFVRTLDPKGEGIVVDAVALDVVAGHEPGAADHEPRPIDHEPRPIDLEPGAADRERRAIDHESRAASADPDAPAAARTPE